MNRTLSRILAVCLILALCLGCGAQAFADTKGATKKSAVTAKKDASTVVKDVKKLMDDGKLYDAALACYDGYYDYPDSEKEFEELWDKIAAACEKNLPKTGELERKFKYQGGNTLTMTAKSGHIEMTAVDKDSKESVRVFIREGESFTLYLPAGRFDLSYKVGNIWFDDKVGFGDFCDDYPNAEYLEIKYTSEGGWTTHYNYTWDM